MGIVNNVGCCDEKCVPKEMALWEILEITEKQISELADVVNAIDSKLTGPLPICAGGKEQSCGLIEQAKTNSDNLSPILSKLYRIAEKL